MLLMTAKDAIKCRQYRHQLDSSQWYFLEVEACFDGEFYDYIDRQVAIKSGT
jgi:tetraacyldisaccharide-1-P 4'-kinase